MSASASSGNTLKGQPVSTLFHRIFRFSLGGTSRYPACLRTEGEMILKGWPNRPCCWDLSQQLSLARGIRPGPWDHRAVHSGGVQAPQTFTGPLQARNGCKPGLTVEYGRRDIPKDVSRSIYVADIILQR